MGRKIGCEEALAIGNLTDLCELIAGITDGKNVETPDYHYTKNPYDDWYSKAYSLSGPAAVGKLAEQVRAGRAPQELLTTTSELTPEFLDALHRYGFTEKYEQTGMVMDLTGGTIPHEHSLNRNVCIVTEGGDIKAWAETADRAFGADEPSGLREILARQKPIRLYGYREDGAIVGCALRYQVGDVAGVHVVGTRPEYRGRHIATAIMTRLVRDAWKEGMTVSCLQASKLGRPVYERIGFRPVSTVIHWTYQF